MLWLQYGLAIAIHTVTQLTKGWESHVVITMEDRLIRDQTLLVCTLKSTYHLIVVRYNTLSLFLGSVCL